MEDRKLEEELWDDEGCATPKAWHIKCGGRVYWILGDEWRCIKCGAIVKPNDMLTPDPEQETSGEPDGI